MTDRINDFVYEFNEYYPFERYIMNIPKQINRLFDDVRLTELFIPSTEIRMHIDEDGNVWSDKIDTDEIYVKVVGSAGEMRFALLDFGEHIIEDIIWNVMRDFGDCNWQSLYVTIGEEDNELYEALCNQRNHIEEKYGECNIKKDFHITNTLNILSK